jgi:hypothetical protein
MQQAGRTFRRYQKLLDDKVLRPIKNIVIADGVARGLIEENVGSRTTRGIFNFGANVSIDLGRESASAISEFKTGLRTAADIYAERGQDFESAMRQRAIEAKLVKDLAGEYEVSADTISDIAMQGLQRETQVQTAQRPTDQPQGQEGDMDMLGGASLNGAQVASLINVINAVAMGAVSKEGAVSIITAAFPTISPDQARAIIAGVNVGTTIPTTKEEKQQIGKDQGGDTLGGSTPPAPEPTTPPIAPAGTSQKKSSLEVLESLDPASIKMLIEGMMGGIELAKYDGIDFTPPQGARDAAKRALDVREGKPSSQRGMTPVGIARARDLQNGVKMSPDTVRRMKAFFDRHEVDKKGATWDEQGKGWQAWNGWGGDAGYAWARKVVGQIEARDKKTEFVAGRDCGQDEGGTFGPDNKCAVGYGRPPLKGGYTPTRPGGKFPKDYKRPTPQGKTERPKEDVKKDKASSKAKIIEKMKSGGLTNVELPADNDAALRIGKSYDLLRERGYDIPPPREIRMASLEGETLAQAQSSFILGQVADQNITFNSRFDKTGAGGFEQTVKKSVEQGWFQTDDLLSHEYGHTLHQKQIGYKEASSLIKEKFGRGGEGMKNSQIAGRVSDYATTNPMEFVAEVFAGHINGKKYDADVMELYKKYKGPELK